jgi:hypothetical protein
VHYALGLSPRQGSAYSARGGLAHLACGPTWQKQGTTLGHGDAGGGGGFRQDGTGGGWGSDVVAGRRCGGPVWGEKQVGGGLTGAVHGDACGWRGNIGGSTDQGSRGQATGSGSRVALHRRSGMGRLGVRRGRGGAAWWFQNGGTTAQWGRRAEEGERVLHRGRAPFIAGRGSGRRAARRWNRGGETVAGSHGRDSRRRPRPRVVGAVRT